MAAGQGFKTFTTGEVLTAADVNGYLMQGINVFASSAARSAAITSPQEGQYSFLKDTNALEYYDGAAWVGAPVGDITAVTAGKGLTGGGSSGDVTVALATTAKGDLVAGSGASTAAVLSVGADGDTIVADSSTATGLKWAKSPNFVGCSVYASAGQTITTNTWTAINFGFEDFDTNTFHDNSTNNSRMTIPTGLGGKYLITYTQRWDPSGAGGRIANIYVNGASYTTQAMNASSTYASNTKSVIFDLAAGWYIQLYAYQDSGSNLIFYGRNEEQPFQIQYLGA